MAGAGVKTGSGFTAVNPLQGEDNSPLISPIFGGIFADGRAGNWHLKIGYRFMISQIAP